MTGCIHTDRLISQSGISHAHGGDVHVHALDRSTPFHLETETLHLHLREPSSGEAAIWDEGKCHLTRPHGVERLTRGFFFVFLDLFPRGSRTVHR